MAGSTVGSLTHAFLFADLRGYTAFAEANGDAAAADLLDRYRLLVRAVIAEHEGAEIRTEGDSFYVVFPSASRAVAAGLAIAERAAAASRAEPERAIAVGIGIQAGEAEERPEGYVGSAVNVAARVCARAKPGEVLVTETVRQLARTSGQYRFSPRGRPRLKGVQEPVPVFRVEPPASRAAASVSNGWWRSRWLAIGGPIIALVVVIGGAIAVGARLGPGGTPGPEASSSPAQGSSSIASESPTSSLDPFHMGQLAPRTYATTVFTPSLRLTFPDGSWSGEREIANEIRADPVGDEGLRQLGLFRVLIGYTGCSAETTTIGPRVQDVVAYLRRNPALRSEPERPAQLGQLDTVMVEFRVGTGCPPPGARDVPLFREVDGADIWDAGEVAIVGYVHQVYLTEVNGQILGVWIAAPEALWPSFQAAARSLLTTLEIVR